LTNKLSANVEKYITQLVKKEGAVLTKTVKSKATRKKVARVAKAAPAAATEQDK
jgi:hypothetical protein